MNTERKKESETRSTGDEKKFTLDQLRQEINQHEEEAFVMEVPIGGERDGK